MRFVVKDQSLPPSASDICQATVGIKTLMQNGQICTEVCLKQTKVYKDKVAYQFADAGPVPVATFDIFSHTHINEACGKIGVQGSTTVHDKVRSNM